MINMKIIITNDDGYRADGINSLADEIEKLSDIVIVAPKSNQSAVSHSFTIRNKPIAVEKKRYSSREVFVVDGTPADCVSLAVLELVGKGNIDMVVSGINSGRNLGYDIYRSGTVAAAREGAFYGIPSAAFSVYTQKGRKTDYEPYAGFASDFCYWLLDRYPAAPELFQNSYININFPLELDRKKVRVTRPCSFPYSSHYRRVRRRGRDIYYFEIWDCIPEPLTDADAVSKGFISISVLGLLDNSDKRKELEELIRQEFEH